MLGLSGWQATDLMGGTKRVVPVFDVRAKSGTKRDSVRLFIDTVPSAEAVATKESLQDHFKS